MKVEHLTPAEIRALPEPKFSLAVCGPEKTGKTHFWCTFPQPIHVAYADPHRATMDGFIRDGYDITPHVCRDWRSFEQDFMPKVVNRELVARTIVVDSYSILSDRYVEQLKGQGDVSIAQWGRIKSKHFDMVTQLVEATHPTKSHPGYHVVITTHMSDILGDDDRLKAVRPAIQGSFKDVFGRCLDTVLFAFVEEPKRIVDAKTGKSDLQVPKHFLYTVPPDKYHAGGDSVGGKGGRKVLPVMIENTYQALCQGWGVKPE